MLKNQINQDLMSAVKEKNTDKIDALRLIKSSIQLEETSGTLHELTDEQIIKIIQKLSKQKEETAGMYINAHNYNAAQKEANEKKVIDSYLPEMLTEDQLCVIIDDIIRKGGYSSIKEMKMIMANLAENYAGQYDGKLVGKIVKELL